MLKNSCAGCLDLSPVISVQFTLEICVAAGNRETFTKTRYFWGARSFKVSDVGTPGKLVSSACYRVIVISSKSVSICNRSHARRANSGKITIS